MDDPALTRDLRLQLLDRLVMGAHGRIGALKSLRRLAWNVETVFAAEGRNGGA